MHEQLRLVEDGGVVQTIASLDNCTTCEQCSKQFTPRAASGANRNVFVRPNVANVGTMPTPTWPNVGDLHIGIGGGRPG